MSANSYLERLATEGVIRELEKVNITRSLSLLKERLNSHFNDAESNNVKVEKHFAFGSYTRGTILPRSMDPLSDVDYMIVFADSEARPQTCLDRLRRFVEKYYEKAEVAQSHPTIVLSLNHIRFELVPAIDAFWSGIQIPGKRSAYSEWMSTTPNQFNERLSEKNKYNDNLIKPLIRLLKYWNASNDYPFESFELEKTVVGHRPFCIILFGGNLWKRFSVFVENVFDVDWADTEHQKNAVRRAQGIVSEVKRLDSDERHDEAEQKLRRLLPV